VPAQEATPAALSTPEEPPRPRLVPRLGAVLWADFGSAPRTVLATAPLAPALVLDAGVQRGRFSLEGELRWTVPVSASAADGRGLSFTRVLGAVVPCAHVGEHVTIAGCLDVELGRVWWSVPAYEAAHGMSTSTGADLYAAGGARVMAEIPLVSPLYLRVVGNVLVTSRPGLLFYPSESGGHVAGFAGGLGLGAGASF
jgi:hypothetical protein